MTDTYDLVVIGSGAAAQSASALIREAGWTVAVIDHRPLGGTCQLRGCDPKKMLVAGEEAIDAARRMRAHGVKGELAIDWGALMAFKRSFTDPVPAKQQKSYDEQGIDTFHDVARFTAPDRLTIGGRELTARHVLIASGASPVPLGIPGEEHVAHSDDFLDLDVLPARIAFIGGGYIAAELSHLAARAGAKVTVVQRGPRLLPRFDADLVGWLDESFEALGIDVATDATVTRVEKTQAGLRVHAEIGGGERSWEADLVVHAAGRAPDLAGLDLGAGGVRVERGRLVLNEFLQSVSNPRVYAAGDAAGTGPALTPVAGRDAELAARNLLGGNRHRPDYRAIPSVAFTLPPIAAVGLDEDEARQGGKRFRVKCEKVPDWFSARRLGEPVYGFKTLVEEDTDRILGAHLVGPQADEVINLFALCVRHGLTSKDLADTVFAYPTVGSDVSSMV